MSGHICHVNVCGKGFEHRSRLQPHLVSHQVGKKLVECTECSRHFKSVAACEKHKKNQHQAIFGLQTNCAV